jgi:excisionase family DNA binding protein
VNAPVDLDTDEFLSITEAAHLLKVGPATMYRWLAGNKLPGFRKGGRLVVRKADLEAFLTPVRADPPPAFRQPERERQAGHSRRTEKVLREAGMFP